MITIFKNRFDSKNPSYYEIEYVLNRIKNGNSKEAIFNLQNTGDKEYKLNLPCICFAGKFTQRNKNSCIESSGIACLDFDNLTDAKAFKEELKKDSFVYCAFISPSGNGVKVLVKIPEDIDQYTNYYEALLDYFALLETADSSCKDISRVCFESYDPEIYINNNSEIWSKVIEHDFNPDLEQIPELQLTDEGKIIDKLRTWLDKNYPITDGQRNTNLFKFASACNDFGVNKSLCEFYCTSNFQDATFKAVEIKKIIDSAYKNTSSHRTKFFDDTDSINTAKKLLRSKKPKEQIREVLLSNGLDDNMANKAIEVAKEQTSGNLVRFWTETETPQGQIKYEILRLEYIEFLNQHGFYRYKLSESSYIFIHVYNNVVKPVELHDIKSYVFNFLKDNYDAAIIEFIAKGVKTYFSKELIELLPYYDYYQHKSSKNESYFYFQNTVVRLDSSKFVQLDYIDLDGFVWDGHIIKRDFERNDNYICDFVKFVQNVSGNEDQKRFDAFCSAIGFLLHDHKDRSYCPAVILNDEKLSDNPEGGTGKGLFMKAISHFKRSITIDGKGFKFDKSFVWQRVNLDTQIINFEDVNKGFDFERLFSLITEGIPVEKKGANEFYIPFDDAPKVCITTNYAIKGDGNSFARRKFEVEFAQYYSKNYTPLHEFGKVMFDGWNSEEWNKFDNFMLSCVNLYLTRGLIEYEHINLAYKKLISETCNEFVEWMDEAYVVNERIKLNDYKDSYLNEYPDRTKYTTTNSFNKNLMSYAAFMGVKFDKTRSNGVLFGEFTDGNSIELTF